MTPDYKDDILLLKQLKTRNIQAFDYLYTSNRKWLYVLALSIVKNKLVAMELVQEMFIDFWQQALDQYAIPSIKSYLSNTLKNRAYNFIRNKCSHEEFVLTQENAAIRKELTTILG
ncbi:RNA polymerase sigma-70 factor, ECF subfamily [Chitinophaga sp. YR573]|uniref:RNA polymerase sigma factor n=1 Tax=Chitinophaga sp. YR573 TaxID=1881040 RepID=UPI0008C6A052|nr:sigma factor [Chitinophaga sp. YR573]SEW04739.1 RNA polymerase sigma-70 factor, ECF subfamily [Chitinophaga sp. YR573]